jgi:hypothetical protein
MIWWFGNSISLWDLAWDFRWIKDALGIHESRAGHGAPPHRNRRYAPRAIAAGRRVLLAHVVPIVSLRRWRDEPMMRMLEVRIGNS